MPLAFTQEDFLVSQFFPAVGGVLLETIGKRSESYLAVGTYAQHPRQGLVKFDMEAAAKYVRFFLQQ